MELCEKENDTIAHIESTVNDKGGVHRSCKRDFNLPPGRRMALESTTLEAYECKTDSTEN